MISLGFRLLCFPSQLVTCGFRFSFVLGKTIISGNYKILIKEKTLEWCPHYNKWLPTIPFILAALESPSTPSCATGTSPRNSLSASSGVRGIVIERTKKKEQIGVTKRGKY